VRFGDRQRPWMRSTTRLVILASLLAVPRVAAAKPSWEIPGVDVRLEVLPAGRLHVVETIDVNFGPNPRPGIRRAIARQIVAPGIGTLELTISDIRAELRPDRQLPVRSRLHDHFLEIEVGEPDRVLSGENVFRLEYDVDGAVVHRLGYDRLIWPAIGGEWDAAIFQVGVVVDLPVVVDAEDVQLASEIGAFGTVPRAADVQVAEPERLVFRTIRGLKMFEAMTVHGTWPAAEAGDTAPGGRSSAAALLLLGALAVIAGCLAAARRARP